MIKRIIDTLIESSKADTTKYQESIYNNCQPNEKGIQLFIDSDMMFDNLPDTPILTINILVLQSTQYLENSSLITNSILQCQNNCLSIGIQTIESFLPKVRDIVSLDSYNVVFYSNKTDNKSAGCRFTLKLITPYPYDYCS